MSFCPTANEDEGKPVSGNVRASRPGRSFSDIVTCTPFDGMDECMAHRGRIRSVTVVVRRTTPGSAIHISLSQSVLTFFEGLLGFGLLGTNGLNLGRRGSRESWLFISSVLG